MSSDCSIIVYVDGLWLSKRTLLKGVLVWFVINPFHPCIGALPQQTGGI